jgi:hypothetical protein
MLTEQLTNRAFKNTLPGTVRSLLVGVGISLSCLLAAKAQVSKPIEIDASQVEAPPGISSYTLGSARSPSGSVLGVKRSFITLDGKAWLPVMGEFHFTRVPESEWEEELLKMKAAGVQVVATYVIWIHHEEIEGSFDWSGQRDLKHFVELCHKHGLYVFVRIGPWAHGEVRNGGFPDWLLKKGEMRSTDPAYMSYVGRYYKEVGAQLRGSLWKDGGPVIGIQLENEFSGRGKLQGEEYILALKKMAIDSGLDVPFYTVTGWDNAVVPRGQVMPVFGGYPDAPWDFSIEQLPPNEVYQFRFASRVTGNMGMIGAGSQSQKSEADRSDTPFITAEMGGGVQDTYHRRPVISADDVAAMMPVMLGSGVNLYGSYMFQGGENPEGKLTTLHQSQETGYPNDLPVKSYDFQAPLGEFGQEREVLRKLKVFDYFLNDFGQQLAPMQPHAPSMIPSSPSDLSVPRVAVRSEASRGFIFMNNYMRDRSMPVRKAFQLRVKLTGQVLTIPERPVDIPSGAYFIWPFNLKMDSMLLRYSTAQLFCKLGSGSASTWVFEAIPGVPSEFVFKDEPKISVDSAGVKVVRRAGVISFTASAGGFESSIHLQTPKGDGITIILLTQTQAENTWKSAFGGRERLIMTTSDFFAEQNTIVLNSMGLARAEFSVYPALDRDPNASAVLSAVPNVPEHSRYILQAPQARLALQIKETRPAGEVAPVRIGPVAPGESKGVAQAPTDEMFEKAEEWQLTIPADALAHVNNVFLSVQYTGDIARLSANGRLLVDDFYNGQNWEAGLKRFAVGGSIPKLTLSILPLRKDAPIFLELKLRPDFSGRSQIAGLKSVTLVPQYQFTVRATE